MLTRRGFYRLGSFVLGGLTTLGMAVPAVAYLLDPLRRKGDEGTTQALTRLSRLEIGVPQSFPVIAERRDAWVKYDKEPIGLVWLLRQPDGAEPPVVAFNAECPHLGCPVSLATGNGSFICRCHQASFDLIGAKTNAVSPRGMDTLQVTLTEEDDPAVIVSFQRYRTQSKEKLPLD